ncbi:type I-E CRISPR-associated protein Cas6/Cse3/CasE [Streptomyces sp. NBC_00102]|uniref:type I-E CRISPR-associated protein Cas6/Cse3/CasE n=1 Tax=Streptomyces sp. NBC_00102 TaxID=2975652 RepID=UPI00224E1FBB|nr:type I-E CRISPR-associated protein Cas6/Cse3/CasE [Streptomyces sp. NBC_00102]MCX5398424.1 type I-E CRISPR-associated protein Cas6/Cse3/CasE [Streptomyces sp. NBC_00102]
MYLTRFRINTARTGARRLLASPQRLHAAVMASFPEAPPPAGQGPRVLWRVDHNSNAEVLLFLTSPTRPDLTHLVEQAGWPAAEEPGWRTFDYATFLGGIGAGSTWAFRLTANPVHSIRRKEGEETKRTAHITQRHQLSWLLQRQEPNGFEIMEKPEGNRVQGFGDAHQVTVHGFRGLAFTKGTADEGAQRGAPVTISTVTYEGRLRVTKPEIFVNTLTSGLGKAKAYGCGLMTLAPVG